MIKIQRWFTPQWIARSYRGPLKLAIQPRIDPFVEYSEFDILKVTCDYIVLNSNEFRWRKFDGSVSQIILLIPENSDGAWI